jgi:hypothetical protein
LLIILCLLLTVVGCYYYGPPPYYPPATTYDQVWESALRAAEDSGIRVTFTDRNGGIIRGATRANTNVDILVMRQADGRMRVEFNRKGPKDQDPGLQDRFFQAYERYMGR